MSMYNMIFGYNPATVLFLPMLDKQPNEYPRFRDCFVGDEKHPEYNEHILIYTRTGGPNRKDYVEEHKAMEKSEHYVANYDDAEDYTYCHWVFKVPDEWKKDFDAILSQGIKAISPEYQDQIEKIYSVLGKQIKEKIKGGADEPLVAP